MYSVTMQSGSEDTHTHSSRMMLGSLRRAMILISFRKSFLKKKAKWEGSNRGSWTHKLSVRTALEAPKLDSSGFKPRLLLCRRPCVTWLGWWRRPSAV